MLASASSLSPETRLFNVAIILKILLPSWHLLGEEADRNKLKKKSYINGVMKA
jgi:hypothetical protein